MTIYPKLSIIVPVFNNEIFIEKCIYSIINQTYKNIELIVIDDGSTDKSGDIIATIQNEDSRVKYIKQENQGVSIARNKGLEISTGEYIGFVDSDDYVDENMYQKLLDAALKNNADIVECNFFTINDEIIISKSDFKNAVLNNKNEILENNFIKKNTANYCWNKLYKKKTILDYKFNKLSYSEDYLFNSLILLNSNIKIVIEDILYFYVANSNSATKKAYNEKYLDMITAGNIVLMNYEKFKIYFIQAELVEYILKKYIYIFMLIEKSNHNEKKRIKKRYDDFIKFYFKNVKIKRRYIFFYFFGNNYVYFYKNFSVFKKIFKVRL
jgi:glycosyltransferase involved in cell wall biosynthesis